MKKFDDPRVYEFTDAFMEILKVEDEEWADAESHQHMLEDGTIITHSHSHTHTQTPAVLNRMARLIGHLNATKKMIETGRDCSEVLTQLAAVDAAIKSVSRVIIKDHLQHCLVEAVEEGDEEAITKLSQSIEQFIK